VQDGGQGQVEAEAEDDEASQEDLEVNLINQFR
jgi:hypothetical protein